MRPQDRPKAVGLVLGVVLVFGMVIMRVKSTLTGGGPAPEASQTVALTSGGTSGSGGISTSPTSATTGGTPASDAKTGDKPIKIAQTTPQKIEDPFRKKGKGEKGEIPIPPSPRIDNGPPIDASTSVASTQDGGSKGDMKGPIGAGDGSLPKVAGGPNAPVNPGTLVPVPDEIKLTGIITGGKPVAVIRMGDKDYVVSQGQSFGEKGNRYTFVMASGTTIVISHDLKTQTVNIDLPFAS